MARINLYAQNRHTLIVDGVAITGFADGDWMEVELNGNEAAITEGGDGPAMSLSTPQGGSVTINLLPTSPALGTLYSIRKAQAASPRMFSIVLMTGVMEIIKASGAAFGKLPKFTTGGPKMNGRQFLFPCLSIELDSSAVESILGSFVGGLI